jgi:hypothetical protein
MVMDPLEVKDCKRIAIGCLTTLNRKETGFYSFAYPAGCPCIALRPLLRSNVRVASCYE